MGRRKRKRTYFAVSRAEYATADEGYRDGYGDGIRRLKRRRPSRWQFLTLDRRLRRAYWEAYGRGYDDGWEQAGHNQRVIIVDKEGNGGGG